MTSRADIQAFQEKVWEYYAAHGRHDLPWRVPESDGNFDPYKILVSEIMLQQTQVARVISKYHEFIDRFPAVEALAQSQLGDVLALWNGLGYNRRAKFLREAARSVVAEYSGIFPRETQQLVRLSGVGVNTAGAVLAYAFNEPVVFIETNIRTVFIHHFFKDESNIPDKEIQTFVEQTLDRKQSREWYWALMDYGSYLKRSVGNMNKASKSYVKQSPFAGSRRQIRGAVLKLLAAGAQTESSLQAVVHDQRLTDVLAELVREGLVSQNGPRYVLGI